uniref:cytochrome c oxidase subunit III n=1 Tax=Parasacculina shiinoi TaxID=2836419 RepID=UPI002551CD56|nr:cytochrome c oxidase subunit III [Parasacculina shiinoi]WGU20874.1 cytochrome c oxidase subunit III [Parasacculina shiinoi]
MKLNFNIVFNFHSCHLVSMSPWPIFTSLSLFSLFFCFIDFFVNNFFGVYMISSFFFLFMNLYCWFSDIIMESSYMGFHSKLVIQGLVMGFLLFIITEIMLFFSFFWSFLYNSYIPDVELGVNWPPLGLKCVNYLSVPLLNTLILISSGFFLTWGHFSLMEGNYSNSFMMIFLTIIFGLYFMFVQLYEYNEMFFNISDSVYGSLFFLMTGFHGMHVLVGVVFLIICLGRLYCCHFSSVRMKGFEFGSWYWHFVDVVWLLLYIIVYVWSV